MISLNQFITGTNSSNGQARLYIDKVKGSEVEQVFRETNTVRNLRLINQAGRDIPKENEYVRFRFNESLKAYGSPIFERVKCKENEKPLIQRQVDKIIRKADKMYAKTKDSPEPLVFMTPSQKLIQTKTSAKVTSSGETNRTPSPIFVRLDEENRIIPLKPFGGATSTKTSVTQDSVLKRIDSLAKDLKLKSLKTKGLEGKHTDLCDLASCIKDLEKISNKDDKDIITVAKMFLNIRVGGVPLGKLTSVSESDWINNNNTCVSQVTDMIKGLTKDFENFAKQIKMGNEITGPSLGMERHTNISVNPQTQVVLNDGTPLPVNRLIYKQHPVALAGGYPTEKGMEKYLQMLVEQKTPCLAVLTPPEQIMKDRSLFRYFSQSKQYGEITVHSTKDVSSSSKVADVYDMKIQYQGKEHSLRVVHALGWPDRGTLPVDDDLRQLAQMVNNYSKGGVPMIHCLGGVGRTGTLAAATLLMKHKNKKIDLDEVKEAFKKSRNQRMMEDDNQVLQLKRLK